MFNPLQNLQQLRDMNQLRQQAQVLQKALEEEKIEVVRGDVRVVVSGNQKIEILEISGRQWENVKETINEAIQQAQQKAAGKLAGMFGQ